MASKSLGTLTLDLVARTAGFVKGMDAAERASDKWKRKVKRNMDDAARAITRLTVVGVGGLTASFAAVVAASTKQEAAIAQVEARIRSTGGAANKTSRELQDLAQALQNATTFGDEDILTAQSQLLTFTNITNEQFDRTLKSVLDLSTAMDQDLKSSVLQLGKALNDPIANLSALSRAGIQFSDEQKEVIKELAESGRLAEAQGVILTELEKQFGGAAEAAADTFGGALKQLQNAFGDLLENPAGLEANKEALQEFVGFLQDPDTINAAQALTSGLIKGFRETAEALSLTVTAAQDLGESIAKALGNVAPEIGDIQDRIAGLYKELEIRQAGGLGGIFNRQIGLIGLSDEEIAAEIRQLESVRELLLSLRNSGPSSAANDPLGNIGIPKPESVAKVADELKRIEVFAQRIETPESVQKVLDAQEAYADLVRDLRTDEEALTDELKDRLKVIQDINAAIPGRDTSETRGRVIQGAFGDAPRTAGIAPEVGGATGELQRLNEGQAQLDEWYAENLERLREYREQKLITDAEYNAQELVLKQKHEDSLAGIEQARQLASLAAAEQGFGALAEITRQFAGEQSDAYKVLFAIEKGAAIARSIIAIQTAIAQAATAGPFPANLAAMASVASATAGLISTIASTTIQGQAHDGLMSVPKTGTYILEQGERVVSAETTKKMDQKLDGMSGSNIRIVNSFDSGEVVGGYLGSSDGERAVMNIVRRNQRTVKSLTA